MRIVQLMPGSGGSFYCENCLRDAGLVRALRALGHDPIIVPLYLPLKLDDGQAAEAAPVFFGGINVYLQQRSGLFRRTPRWVDRVFDSPRLLKLVSRLAGMTNATTLAETTLSMLRGEHGHQVKELDRLVEWLGSSERPDVVCISNALLLGMARRIKADLGAAVVCSLQDEDIFLDGLPEPQRGAAWDLMAERATEVDAFVAVSRYYGDHMRERLSLPADRVHVVHNGIATAQYEPAPSAPEPPVIGYLERLCPEKGFDILVEAFIRLKAEGQFGGLRLRLAGGWTANDEPFLDAARERLDAAGVGADVEFLPNLELGERLDFLRSLSVLSVPARHAEAFGMYVLEALAAGVPVVVPRHGAFPELLEATGGGVLCEPEDPDALAAVLAELLSDTRRARDLGRAGREAVLAGFDIRHMAQQVVRVYEAALAGSPQPPSETG